MAKLITERTNTMKKTRLIFIALVATLVLVTIPLFSAQAQDKMPDPIDPQSWRFSRDMTWDDWVDNTAFNWRIDGDKIVPQSVKKGLLVLCDFEDRPFVVCSPEGSEQMGNPLVGSVDTKDLVEFWESFLNDPVDHFNNGLNKGITISEFWQENTQGRWKIELDAVGVYTLPGYEFEYGLDTGMNHTNDLPAGFTRRSGLNTLAINAAIADGVDLMPYDFAFILHSGSTESGLWEEAGYMMFYDETTIGYEFSAHYRVEQMRAMGIQIPAATDAWLAARPVPTTGEAGRGWWARTRYVPWTSWWAASAIWSSSGSINVPGKGTFRLSQQGETNGNGVFSHEFGHISTIADNYGSDINQRAYTGFWDLMCNGSMTGFGGNHTRYEIPNLHGGSIPAHMLTRTKRKLGFLDDNQLCNVNYAALSSGAPVVTEIYSRTTPVGDQFAAIYPQLAAVNDKVKAGQAALGLRLYNFRDTKGRIQSALDWESETFNGANWYDNYTVEVVDQVGYDSHQSDHGVLICKNRETLSESVPYSWLVNAHPGGLDTVDFYTPTGPNGEPSIPQALRNNDSNHLSAALFHAGKSVTPNNYGVQTIRTGQTNADYKVALDANGQAIRKSIADNTVNEYIDEGNKLHFYILDKLFNPGPYGGEILSYQVGVRHFEGLAVGGALEVSLADVDAEIPGRVAVAVFDITNTGEAIDIIRVGMDGVFEGVLLNDLYAVGAGETVTVTVYFELPATIAAKDVAGQDIVFTASSETNGEKVGMATVAAQDLVIFNFYSYMDTAQIAPLAGDTIFVDVLLKGNINYTQFNAAVTYDASLLEYVGHANLSGLAAEVKPAGNQITRRSVPSLNMLLGASCIEPVRIATLKFKVKDKLDEGKIATYVKFAALDITPAAGVKALTAPGKALELTLMGEYGRETLPEPLDPQSWQLHRDMSWHDLKPNPVVNWMEALKPEGLVKPTQVGGGADRIRGGLILVEYLDRKFISRGDVGSDPLGYYRYSLDGSGLEDEIRRNPMICVLAYIAAEKYDGDISQVTDADFAQWWADYLNKAQPALNHGLTIDEFWRENSYGKWAVDLLPFGPFTIPYFEFEAMGYDQGSSFQTYRDVPPSFRRGASGTSNMWTFDSIAIPHARDNNVPFSTLDFFFLLHAGYDESGVWQEFGQAQFASRKDIPYELGPGPRMRQVEQFFTANPEWLVTYAARYAGSNPGAAFWAAELTRYNALVTAGTPELYEFKLAQDDWDWVEGYNDMTQKNTRYVAFTSWEAAVGEWSHMSSASASLTGAPRTLNYSTQGESDGMSGFAHEFGHVTGILDNYGNPWTDVASAATEPWEIMSRGAFAGPFGDHARWTVPGVEANSVPVHMMTRNKYFQNFYDAGDMLEMTVQELAGGTPVVAEISARNIPLKSALYPFFPEKNADGAKFYKGIRLRFGSGAWADQATFRTTGFTWARRAAASVDMEVVERTSYDTYNHDHGVLLSRVHVTTGNPYQAIIDSHLYDIDLVDYFLNGEPNYYPLAHASQLADATFHAGTSFTDTGYYRGGEYKGDKRISAEVVSGNTVNEFYDPYNKLHFYILEKNLNPFGDNEFLSYQVAMRHDSGMAAGGALSLTAGRFEPASAGRYAVQYFTIKDTGASATDIIRITLSGELADKATMLNNLYAIQPNGTIEFAVYIEAADGVFKTFPSGKLTVSVSSETNALKTVTY